MNVNDYRHILEPALQYSGETHSWDDVVAGVASGYMQLWVNGQSAAITEIVAYPQKKVLNVFLAGGNTPELIAMLEDAKLWGASEGCSEIVMYGRKGWERKLSPHGWKVQHVVMSSQIL